MHVCPEHGRSHQVVQAQSVQLLFRDKLEIVIHGGGAVFFQFFRQAFQEGAPRRRGAKRGDEVRLHLWCLRGHQDEALAIPHAHIVQICHLRFNGGERLSGLFVPNPDSKLIGTNHVAFAGRSTPAVMELQVDDGVPVLVIFDDHGPGGSQVVHKHLSIGSPGCHLQSRLVEADGGETRPSCIGCGSYVQGPDGPPLSQIEALHHPIFSCTGQHSMHGRYSASIDGRRDGFQRC
eukprot:scaffold408_cov347-Pavlova_lutheri.AAC.40